MSIESKILGFPGQDNNVYLKVDSGQHVHRIFFDCGDSGFSHLGKGILQNIDHLFFSHCHVDHIAGFDALFRHLYSRSRALNIFGPKGIINIMHSRFQGFSWNLVKKCPGEVHVHEIEEDKIISVKFLCKEGFKNKHKIQTEGKKHEIYKNKDFTVEAIMVDHNLPCLSFSLKENKRLNINSSKMDDMGLKPGMWCSFIKRNDLPKDFKVEINSIEYELGMLQEELLEVHEGEKIVYATDFIMNKKSLSNLTNLAIHADELIIECMYKTSEKDLAKKNYHLTVDDAAILAKESNVKRLTLIHVSDRYTKADLIEILNDARKIFANSFYPSHWKIGK